MRKKNSIKNMIGSISSNIVTIIVGLIAQALFIKILGIEYLGLNGLFSNIISMLGIVELGIGNAIIYNMYKPIAEKNVEKIKSLMEFYKKSYHLIAFLVLIIGLILVPFLRFIVDFNSVTVSINVYSVYFLFLIDIICSYFLSYKRSILYANQKNYLINYVHIGYTIVMNALQLIILFITKNYYLYLVIKIIMRIIENLIITKIANQLYSYLNDQNIKPLDKETEKDIFKKIKALFFHKIGGFIVLGTDNIIISKYLGLVTVGLYSNYYMIINAVQTIFSQVIQSTTASIGNLLVTESKEKQYEVFTKMRFLNFWLSCFSSIAVLVIIQSFITIWIGKEYLLSMYVLIILVINLYQKLMRSTYSSFKEAAGIYYEDRFVPLFESIINIIVSILLVKLIGLPGVFIGTIISGLALWCYSYPKFIYKKLFNRSYWDYAKETIGYIVLFLIISLITYSISNLIVIDHIYLQFLCNVSISLIVPNLILLIIFYKNNNFQYYFKFFKKGLSKNNNKM